VGTARSRNENRVRGRGLSDLGSLVFFSKKKLSGDSLAKEGDTLPEEGEEGNAARKKKEEDREWMIDFYVAYDALDK
jgi:hypothetical protein